MRHTSKPLLLCSKYKLIESQLMRSNENMTQKIPEIEKAVDIIATVRREKCIVLLIV